MPSDAGLGSRRGSFFPRLKTNMQFHGARASASASAPCPFPTPCDVQPSPSPENLHNALCTHRRVASSIPVLVLLSGALLSDLSAERVTHGSRRTRWFVVADNSDLLKAGGSAVIFDYFNDTKLVRKGE